MDTARVTHEGREDTRETRALALYRERGEEIRHLSGNFYRVPSQDGSGSYDVDYEQEVCPCADFTYRGGVCVHLYAVGIWHAKHRIIPADGDPFLAATRSRLEELHSMTKEEHKGRRESNPFWGAAKRNPLTGRVHRAGAGPHLVKLERREMMDEELRQWVFFYIIEHPEQVAAIRAGCLQFCEDEGLEPSEELFAEVVVETLSDAARDARSVVGEHFSEEGLARMLEESSGDEEAVDRRMVEILRQKGVGI